MENFNIKKFIINLCSIGERQLSGETQARTLILNILDEYCIPYSLQQFTTSIPKTTKEKLTADGEKIAALSTSFVSGTINSAYATLSSLISSQQNLYDANINFNPRSEGISRSNYYFAPSLAISKKDLPKILAARIVQGSVIVKKIRHESANIIVGNIKNPKKIIFCHYDSIATGASDNASGVGVIIDYILRNPASLMSNAFVITGNEELSYDQPIYWGHGYRVFESKHSRQLEKCKKIIIVDSLGTGKTQIFSGGRLLTLAFPIKKIGKYTNKVSVLSSEFDSLMAVYHSALDTPETLNTAYIKSASRKLAVLIST